MRVFIRSKQLSWSYAVRDRRYSDEWPSQSFLHTAHTEVEFMQRTKPTIMNNIYMDAKLTSRKRKSMLETFFGI